MNAKFDSPAGKRTALTCQKKTGILVVTKRHASKPARIASHR